MLLAVPSVFVVTGYALLVRVKIIPTAPVARARYHASTSAIRALHERFWRRFDTVALLCSVFEMSIADSANGVFGAFVGLGGNEDGKQI